MERIVLAALDNLPSFLYVKDPEGHYLYGNRAVLEFFGMTSMVQLIGKTDFDLMDHLDADTLAFGDERALTLGRYELEYIMKDVVIQDIKISLSRPGEDKPYAVAGVATDITARRMLERELRQVQRMEALGELSRSIVHDFHHILAIVKGHLRFIAQDIGREDGERERRDLEQLRCDIAVIQSAIAEGEELTARLTNFAREKSEVESLISFNDVIHDLVGILHFPLMEIELDLGEDVAIRASRHDMHQILFNLAVNARDAMPTGGVVRISTAQENGWAVLRVSDTGPGIPVEIQEKIFEPFYTTKPVGQGTGLGLSIVYGIVRRMRGDVSIASAKGESTMICVKLPVAQSAEGGALQDEPVRR